MPKANPEETENLLQKLGLILRFQASRERLMMKDQMAEVRKEIEEKPVHLDEVRQEQKKSHSKDHKHRL